MTIVPGDTPCLRCFMDRPPAPGTMPSCDTEGVLSAITATVASIQSVEALKLLTGHAPMRNILAIDLWAGEFQPLELKRRPGCPTYSENHFEYLAGTKTAWTTVLCGRNAVQIVPPEEHEISLADLQTRLRRIGNVSFNGFLLTFSTDGEREIVLFPTGRAIIRGTTDEAEARALYARYIGI